MTASLLVCMCGCVLACLRARVCVCMCVCVCVCVVHFVAFFVDRNMQKKLSQAQSSLRSLQEKSRKFANEYDHLQQRKNSVGKKTCKKKDRRRKPWKYAKCKAENVVRAIKKAGFDAR